MKSEAPLTQVRVGIVSWWFNRGQATVGRYLRLALEELGHEVHVLARQSPAGKLGGGPDRFMDVWDQDRVVPASSHAPPFNEYRRWVVDRDISTVFFFQNYSFDAIRRLRSSGVRTIGTFMWEDFGPAEAEAARSAFDTFYALNTSSAERYESFGLDIRRVPWCVPPDLARHRAYDPESPFEFHIPAGYLSNRKCMDSILHAFEQVDRNDIRLVVKAQRLPIGPAPTPSQWARIRRAAGLWRRAAARRVEARKGDAASWPANTPRDRRSAARQLVALCERDPRVRLILGDLSVDEHFELMSTADVLLSPARWEGLGLHFYEALALGLPTITCDQPPMNELVIDGVNGYLVDTHPVGTTPSGVTAVEPDVTALSTAIDQIADVATLRSLHDGARGIASEYTWESTVNAIGHLLQE